jgi:hypothetical protein
MGNAAAAGSREERLRAALQSADGGAGIRGAAGVANSVGGASALRASICLPVKPMPSRYAMAQERRPSARIDQGIIAMGCSVASGEVVVVDVV